MLSKKVDALLKLKGRTKSELGRHMGMSPQAISNKFYRNTFSAKELVAIADFLSADLIVRVDDVDVKLN